jgi:colanic acid biosynthesis glycosyl transferase WcaI
VTVIFINRFFYPDHSATSQLLSDLAFGLAAQGYAVSVVTSRQRYDTPQDFLPAGEVISQVRIIRSWTSRFGRINLVGRAIDYLTFYLSASITLLRTVRRGDILVAATDPPMLSVVVGPIARLKGAKLVNWLQDIFPEVAEAVGVGKNPVMLALYGLMRRLRTRSLQSADQNVVLGQRMAERVRAFGVAAPRITIIPNWADGRHLKPIASEQNPLREAWELQGRFVVGYSGNLGRAHEYQTLLKSIEKLAAWKCDNGQFHGSSIVWLFVGGGVLYDSFRKDADACGFDHVHFKPYQPREILAQSLSVADVHLVSLRPELEGLIVPSKFYGIAAVGRPTIFIGDQDGEIAEILREHDCGMTVAEGDTSTLAESIQKLASDRVTSQRLGENARRAFESHFDQAIAMARWTGLLCELGLRLDRPNRVPPQSQIIHGDG